MMAFRIQPAHFIINNNHHHHQASLSSSLLSSTTFISSSSNGTRGAIIRLNNREERAPRLVVRSSGGHKYNMFVAQIGCAAFGVLALMMFGPGWIARGTALAASIAFMTLTGALHPPAASLPILFIDGAKFHNLNLCYALFPGATGCLILCLNQEMVTYPKNNFKF